MDDLVKRADEALRDVTPGPWAVKYDLGDTCLMMGSDCQMCNMAYYPWTPGNDADWHFIAAARELVPAMRDRIEADAKRIAEAVKLLDERDREYNRLTNEMIERHAARIMSLAADREELRAAIFGSHNYDPALRNGNFREMAETLHVAQRGGLARAEAAEARIAELDAALREIADCEEYDRCNGEFALTEEALIARAALGEKK